MFIVGATVFFLRLQQAVLIPTIRAFFPRQLYVAATTFDKSASAGQPGFLSPVATRGNATNQRWICSAQTIVPNKKYGILVVSPCKKYAVQVTNPYNRCTDILS